MSYAAPLAFSQHDSRPGQARARLCWAVTCAGPSKPMQLSWASMGFSINVLSKHAHDVVLWIETDFLALVLFKGSRTQETLRIISLTTTENHKTLT